MRKLLKNQAGFSVIETLLVILVLAGIGFAGWFVYERKVAPPVAATNVTQTAHQTSRYQALYDQLKSKLGQLQDVTVADDTWAAQIGSGAALSTSDYDYSVSTQMLPGLRVGAQPQYNPQSSQEQVSTVVQKTVDSVMAQAGYTVSNKPYGITGYAPGDKVVSPKALFAAYEKNNDNCLSTYTSGDDTITCFTPNDIIQALARAQPYVAAYRSANPTTGNQQLVFGPMTIKSQAKSGAIGPSVAAGYDISEAVIADGDTRSVVIYYRKDAGPWTYITKAADEFGFSCDAYAANADVSKAMYNQICLGPNGQIHYGTGTKGTQ